MHAVPEKLSALRESFEATLKRQLFDYRTEFEGKLKVACKTAEENAVRRAEEALIPKQFEVRDEFKNHLRATHALNEEAISKTAAVADSHAALTAEVHPIHARCDAAAARLDRLAVQTATTAKDCSDLGTELRKAVMTLHTDLVQETTHRSNGESDLKGLIEEARMIASRATKEAVDAQDLQNKAILMRMTQMEERLLRTIDESHDRSAVEAQLGDQEIIKTLRPEIVNAAALAESKAEETYGRAESDIRSAMQTLREECEAACKRTRQDGDRYADRRVAELDTKTSEGLEGASASLEAARSALDKSLEDAVAMLRKAITDARAGSTTELELLRHEVTSIDSRLSQSVSDAERRAVDASSRQLETTATDLTRKLAEAREKQEGGDDALRVELSDMMARTAQRLENATKDAAEGCNNTMSAAVSHASALLRSEFAEGLRGANDRTDAARCAAAEQLHTEVEGRQSALKAAEAARDALEAKLRDELHAAFTDANSKSQTLTDAINRRVDSTNADLSSLDRSVGAFRKEYGDFETSLRSQLKTERQQTEAADTEINKLLVQTRDTLGGQLKNDVNDLRTLLANCRQRLTEETGALRKQLREQPTKQELTEVVTMTTDRCNEVAAALDSCRNRLEAATQEFATRCRDVSSESQEARLRMQREAMALGNEVTHLRAAASSLANGVVKALTVIGLIREESLIATEVKKSSAQDGAGQDGAHPVTGAAIGAEAQPAHHKVMIEDLLQWEKIGKSLASRVARQWYNRETAGFPTLLSLVDAQGTAALTTLGATMTTCATPTDFAAMSLAGPTAPAGPPKQSPKSRQQQQKATQHATAIPVTA